MFGNVYQTSQDPTAFIIFGVTGDLTRRKLVPALYELRRQKHLPEPFFIVGFARREWDAGMMAEQLTSSISEFTRTKPVENEVLDSLCAQMRYVRSTFEDEDGYNRLHQLFDELGIVNCVYYLAVPPEDYVTIIRQIGKAQLAKFGKGWTRIVIEKPYGRDLQSAEALNAEIHQVFDENQIYRIDHYLGKETVQNILVFRFANGIFEPLWNRGNVDHVCITVAESVGVGSRAGYYEQSGVIRDVFQNHMLQLLALTAMEAPVAFNADAVRDEKVKILKSLRPLKGKDALANTHRAQYVAGTVDGQRVPGYKDEPGVSPSSVTETYLALRLFVDNWRWAGVPFYLRSGKRLPQRVTSILIHFKQVPLALFGWRNTAGDAPNILTINVQPDEGITLTFGAKAPGPINEISPVSMQFDYVKTFGGEPPEAYERLLMDCLSGDATLFTRTDEVLAAWAFTTEIINSWIANPIHYLPVYEAGTWGPPGADEFIITEDGHGWHNPVFDSA